MKTAICTPDDLTGAISFLQKGEVIAIPTETVYGLAAMISSEKAMKKIFTVKNRPQDNPLIVHVSKKEQVKDLVEEFSSDFEKLTHAFWPGPLTLVMKKNANLPHYVTLGLDSIAIRMPEHPVAQALIEEVGPLAAPSANLSGKPSPTTAFAVLEDLEGKIPLVIDGGNCAFGIESTVISLLRNTPYILRHGSISKQQIETCLQKEVFEGGEDLKKHSPGTKYRHYAPKAKVRLIFDEEKLDGKYILSLHPKPHMRLLSEKTLYEELRQADRLGISEIQVECTKELQDHLALFDRLKRASKN